MGRPRKDKTKTDELIDKFSAAFADKFGDKPVLKTPLHFFEDQGDIRRERRRPL